MRLNRLWVTCALLIAALLLVTRFFACVDAAVDRRGGPTVAAPRPPAPPAKPAPKPAPLAQSYTYVGPAANPTARSEKDKTGVQKDSTHQFAHRESAPAQRGRIPDLDIDLAGQAIAKVMARYGYCPAVKTTHRLLGKIVGRQFMPLTAAELAQYARRGRSGADYPDAQTWLSRIGRELDIPAADLELFFLVPLATEQQFVAVESTAVRQAGKTLAEIALVRAHFDSSLEIVVDALVTIDGETLPVP